MGSEDDDYEEFDYDAEEAESRKREVGMAEPGSDEYYYNAYYILKSYSNPNAETRAKLDWLKSHGYNRGR